jgi:hypothetical protein
MSRGAKACIIAKICRAAALAAALLPAAAAAQAPFPQLPPNESGLAEMLESGDIDSAGYGQLLAFYALPLSVPRGEMGYLALAFPEAADFLPATPEELAEYEPYDAKQLKRLFSDYPALGLFEPILRFNAAEARSPGEVAVGFNRSRASAPSGRRARFRWGDGAFSAEGAVTLDDSAALWQSRRAAASRKGAVAQVGNFKRRMPGAEMATGAFAPSAPLPETAAGGGFVAENYLYGGSAAWNGASLDIRELPGAAWAGAGAFCHLRPGETGWGAEAAARAGKQASFSAAAVGFNGRNFALLSAGYRADGKKGGAGVCEIAAVAAAPLSGENRAPALTLRLSHRAKGAAAEYALISFPANFDAPNSREKKKLLAETGEKDPTAPLLKHAFKTAVPLAGGAAKLLPELDFASSGGVRRIRAQVEARANAGGAAISARHAAKIFPQNADSALHASSAAVNYRPNYPAGVNARFQCAYGGGKKTNAECSAEFPVTAIPNAVVTPYARGKIASENEGWLGVKCEVHLYKKTWTAASAEAPVNTKGERGVYVKVASSYSF